MNWKPLARRVAHWTVPPGFQSLMRRTWAARRAERVLSPAMKALFARNIKFRNIHEGQRCFILATGPSINKQDLKPLRNEICFAVSQFFLHKDIREIDPLYHVDASHHAPYGFEVLQKAFEGFNKFYSSRTTYFFGHTSYEYSVYNFLEQYPQFKKDNIHYLNYCYSQPLDETNYNNPDVWDVTKNLFSPRSVVYCAIQIATYMGFQSVYLLGCDHDYFATLIRGVRENFYEAAKSVIEPEEMLSTEETLFRYYLRWKQYRLMRSYLKPRDCYIYNATEGGLLDVFPRVSLSEALSDR